MPEWIKLGLPVVATLVASYFSAKWGARAFQERWWDRKEKAYVDIIEALHELIRITDIRHKDELEGTERSEIELNEMRKLHREALLKIEKATNVGAFVISPLAAAVLEELNQRPCLVWGENPPWEIYESECEYYRIALNKIRVFAKLDLKV